jgi:hypothetical protein
LPKDLEWKATPASRQAALASLRERQAKQAASYAWVDQKAGVVQLPIARAMELTLQEFGAKNNLPAMTTVSTNAPAEVASAAYHGPVAVAAHPRHPGDRLARSGGCFFISPSRCGTSATSGGFASARWAHDRPAGVNFVYGWAANAGLGLALWLLGRLGGSPLRAQNWIVCGTLFWNFAIFLGLVGIATGDATSIVFLELPRDVQGLMLVAYACVSMSGVVVDWSPN